LFGSQTLETYALSVSQLKNPQSLPPNVADVLKAHGLTESDFADILALDPFAQGQTAIDTDRYAATTYSFPYQPPPTGGSCTGGTCSCLAFVEAIKNDFQGAHTSTAQSYKDVGFNESAGVEGPVGKDLFSATVKSTQKWTWSNSSSTENDTDNSQSASLTITCASPAYTNPADATEMLVYFDRIFGTFLFVPTLSVASQRPIHQGFLTRGGEAAAHVPVQLTVDGKTYHTFTNNSGGYVFYGPAAAIQRGTLSVGGQAFELPLTPTMPAAVEIR